MTFMGIYYSSTLEVGTGKSVFCTQLGEEYTELMNKEYGCNLKFDENNIVWNPEELIKRSFELKFGKGN